MISSMNDRYIFFILAYIFLRERRAPVTGGDLNLQIYLHLLLVLSKSDLSCAQHGSKRQSVFFCFSVQLNGVTTDQMARSLVIGEYVYRVSDVTDRYTTVQWSVGRFLLVHLHGFCRCCR